MTIIARQKPKANKAMLVDCQKLWPSASTFVSHKLRRYATKLEKE